MSRRNSHLLVLSLVAAALGIAGCASNKPLEHPSYVPLDASLAATGAAPISAMAYPGQAYYVTDEDRHALVFSSRVPQNFNGAVIVKIDRDRKAIVITPTKERDPELVLLENINPSNRYTIWLSDGYGGAGTSATSQRLGM